MLKKIDLYFVFGGAVSAGAYTAGAIDYFMLCLKEYMSKPENEREYDIKIKAITGTSAGGMCGSILLHDLLMDYPFKLNKSNLYKAWVKDIDIKGLSTTSDLADKKFTSLLNGDTIKKIAHNILSQDVDTPENINYLYNDCKLILSVTDTLGKSYKIDFLNDPNSKPYYTTNHRDYFCFTVGKSDSSNYYMSLQETRSWQLFEKVSIATGAFPIGLPTSQITRPSVIYSDSNNPNNPNDKEKLGAPINIESDTHTYYAVDGGIGDNEPFDRLSRLIKAEDTNAEKYVIFIDPFPSNEVTQKDTSFKEQLSRLYQVLRNQSSYKPEEIINFSNNPNVKSYSITPKSSSVPNPNYPLAGSFFSAFSGFIDESFREYDYNLGKRNCQKFLKDHLTIFGDIPKNHEVITSRCWPSISEKYYNEKTKALDKRIAKVSRFIIDNWFWGSILEIYLRISRKTSKLIKRVLIDNGLVQS